MSEPPTEWICHRADCEKIIDVSNPLTEFEQQEIRNHIASHVQKKFTVKLDHE